MAVGSSLPAGRDSRGRGPTGLAPTQWSPDDGECARSLSLGIPPASGIGWYAFPWFAIRRTLIGWLRSCRAEHAGTEVLTIGARHAMSATDGLVSLVGDRSHSVITRVGAPESPSFGVGQTSHVKGEILSEVHADAFSPYGAAATTYHELLHSKLRLADDVHATPGGNFTTALAPYDEGGPSAADRRLMCSALSAVARQ